MTQTRYQPWILLAAGVGVTLLSGVVYGRFYQRWGPNTELQAAAKHLATLPEAIGDWQFVESEELSESAMKQLQCAGYAVRSYVSRKTGATVKLALIAGPPGPIAVHTPEVCYDTRAWKLEEDRQRQEVEAGPMDVHTFWGVTMRSDRATGERLRVYYAWTPGEKWHASDSPRYEFARSPYLVKLQLAGEIPFGASSDEDPCRDFLEALVNSGWTVGAEADEEAAPANR